MRLPSALCAAALILAAPAAVAQTDASARVAGPALAETPPPAPPPGIARWIGAYYPEGAAAGPLDGPLTLYEDGGRLHALGQGLDGAPAAPRGPGRLTLPGHGVARVVAAHAGEVAALELGGRRLVRRDVGAEARASIQAGVRAADWPKLRAAALAAAPPPEPPPARAFDLVRVTAVTPDARLDIRYATADNFMGVPLYERADAWLQRPAAEALARAAATLRARGLGVLIYDGYRPWPVTKLFWDATPPEDHVFVADPAQGSRHNRGCAVDLGLYDLRTGATVPMPSRYDEMSPHAYPDFRGGTSRARWYRAVLRQAMEREGFTVYPQEWWHFDYKDWPSYGIGRETLSELEAAHPR